MNRRRHAPLGPLLLVTGALGLAGCEGKLAKLPDAELQDHVQECNNTVHQAPGFAIRCDNYRRECQRRRDQGRILC
jgi:hypothetical protein